MMDSTGKSLEKSTKKYECDPCKLDGENISGEFYCFECQEYLCERCKKEHKRYKSSRNHNIVSASDADKKDTTMAAAEVEKPCTEHKGEMLKDRNDEVTEGIKQMVEVKQFFDKIKEIELKAEIVSSRKRQNATSIQNQQTTILGKADDVIKKAKAEIDGCYEEFRNKVSFHYKEQTTKLLETEGLKQKDEKEQLSDKMKEIESDTEMVASRKRGIATSIQNQLTIILGKADDVIQKAKAKLDKSYEKFKDQVSYQHKKLTTKLLNRADKIDSIQNSITDYKKIWTGVTETGFKPMFTLHRIAERVESHSKELDEYVKEDRLISLDTEISTRELDITTVETLAEVKVKLSFSENTFLLDMDDLSNAGNAKTNVCMKTPHIDDLEAVRVWDVTDDEFLGGTFLRDGRLLLVGRLSNTLKVYSDNGKKEICHSVSYHPLDAAQHSDDRIYILSNFDKCIRVYTLMSLSNTLQEVKSINTDISSSFTYAISITTDNHILAASSQCINVMTMEGKTRQTIITSDWKTCIATSSSDTGAVFYYCDGSDVVCQSIAGAELLRYKIPGIGRACGIAIDTWDNIYVCGKLCQNVFVVSKDGKSNRIFLSNIVDVCDPIKVGFDKRGSKFFVTDGINGNTAVFQLNVKK